MTAAVKADLTEQPARAAAGAADRIEQLTGLGRGPKRDPHVPGGLGT